jgi:hypothetical protein
LETMPVSRSALPTRRVLSAVNREHDDRVVHRSEVDSVRESRQHRASNFVVDSRELERMGGNPFNYDVDSLGECSTET